MSRRSQRHHIPDGFALSTDMYAPSTLMQGRLPNQIRAGQPMMDFSSLMGSSPNSSSSRQRGALTSFSPEGPFGQLDLMNAFHNDMLMPSFSSFGSMMREFSAPMQGGGVYQSSVTVMSSYTDENGKQKVEKYKKAAYGNTEKDMHEICEAYSNEDQDIMARERRHQNRGLQCVKRRDGRTQVRCAKCVSNPPAQVIEETQQPIGMEESDIGNFNQQWYTEFAPHLPQLGATQQGHPAQLRQPQRRQLQQ